MRQKKDIFEIVMITLIFEAITVFFRFGLHLKSNQATASTIGQLTGGVRIHHGYIGIILVLLANFLGGTGDGTRWVKILGFALFLSDMVHHFLVLYPITGSPEFDFFYPK